MSPQREQVGRKKSLTEEEEGDQAPSDPLHLCLGLEDLWVCSRLYFLT